MSQFEQGFPDTQPEPVKEMVTSLIVRFKLQLAYIKEFTQIQVRLAALQSS